MHIINHVGKAQCKMGNVQSTIKCCISIEMSLLYMLLEGKSVVVAHYYVHVSLLCIGQICHTYRA